MEQKVFGYPKFDQKGAQILTTYENEYRAMNMDIRVYRMKAREERIFLREQEETAILLLSGKIKFIWEKEEETVARKDVFTEGPFALHVCKNVQVSVKAEEDSEILVQCTKNMRSFAGRLYHPEDAPWKYSRHPQPECYYFKFDHPEGFGASCVGDQVFKSVDGSFSAIPGGELHPQAVAPGFQMYTCWMIRHIDGNPWLQTDRCEDERYLWLHEAQF